MEFTLSGFLAAVNLANFLTKSLEDYSDFFSVVECMIMNIN